MDIQEVFVDSSYPHTLKIPKEWVFTPINNAMDIVGGNQPPKSEFSAHSGEGLIRLIQIRDYKSDANKVYIPLEKAKRFVSKDDVMIGRYGPPIFQILRGLEGAYNVALMKAVPVAGAIDNEFLYYYLQNRDLYNYVEAASDRTAGQSGVNKAHLEKYPFPLPPLAEQKVIADKLDTLLAQVETSKARLDRIPKILKTFRQSVLAAAVSGKLTEEWRGDKRFNVSNELKQIHKSRDELYQKDNKKHFDKTGKNLRKYDYSTLNEEPVVRAIPEGWELVKLGEIVSFLTDYHANGSYEVLKEHVELKETEDYACMIRATNFEKNNFYDLFVYISEEAYEFLEKSKLYGNEILIGKIGNAGSVYLMPKLDKPASLAMNLFALRFDEKLVNPSYIYMFLNSSLGESNIQKYVKGVATKSIDKKSVRSVFINYPSFEEQSEIVHRVEELFAFAERIEEKGNAALERVNNLTQSILAKAFRGELTADWRAANPELISGENSAEALLEKIKAEREALSSNKKPKKKAVKKAK